MHARQEFLLLNYLRNKVEINKNSTLGQHALLKMIPNSLRFKASVKWWPWAKSLQGHCLANFLKFPVGSQWLHTSRVFTRKQMPDSPGQWWHRADTPKMGTPELKGTVDPLDQHLHICLSSDFVTLGMPTLLPATEVNPVWWEPTRLASQELT